MLSSSLLAAILAVHVTGQEMSPKQYLEQLERVLPESAEWEQWLDTSGELPPDFSALDTIPNPRSPLAPMVDGEVRQIGSVDEWDIGGRTQDLFQHWVLGTIPPRLNTIEAVILQDSMRWRDIREVELRFDRREARLRAELMIPTGKGPSGFHDSHNHRAWALIALRRGYLACVYAGSDSQDDTDTFLDAYPEYDWSRLMRRAWAAGRCIDYLETEPFAEVSKIALTGHSRNGKQSLMASAFDERVAVVISSSAGAGGCHATRCYSDPHLGEHRAYHRFPEWFHPRWRSLLDTKIKSRPTCPRLWPSVRPAHASSERR